jgi:hypothetical protein
MERVTGIEPAQLAWKLSKIKIILCRSFSD